MKLSERVLQKKGKKQTKEEYRREGPRISDWVMSREEIANAAAQLEAEVALKADYIKRLEAGGNNEVSKQELAALSRTEAEKAFFGDPLLLANAYRKLEAENEELQDKERRAWEYARFFSGRSELLRLHIRTHLRLSHKDCIGWGEHDYRDALLTDTKEK